MRYIIMGMLLALAGCSASDRGPEPENGHYQEWKDGAGWKPDYHDENRTR
jgi:hypothetical protein